MLTAAQVATQLGLKPRTVYDLADSGRLPCYRMGVRNGALRFDEQDVEAYRRTMPPKRPEPPMPTARALRNYARMRRLAEAYGPTGLPELTEQQQAIVSARHRHMRAAPWADSKAIAAMYAEARRLTAETGVPHHVDHIVPLQGEFGYRLRMSNSLGLDCGASRRVCAQYGRRVLDSPRPQSCAQCARRLKRG